MSACIRQEYVAIEVQISTLAIETVIFRTLQYSAKGIALLWLAQWDDSLEGERYSPRPWELWVHAAYYGRVYYWRGGRQITPVHFSPYYNHVEQTYWHDEDGDEQSGGGFYRKSKRYRSPIKGDDLDLLLHFNKKPRESFVSGNLIIPEALLYCDRGRKFW